MSSEDIQAASFLLDLSKEPVLMLPPVESLLSSQPTSHIDSFTSSPSMMDIHMITHATNQDPMPLKKKDKAAATQSPSPTRRRRISSNNSGGGGGSSSTTTDITHRPRRTTMTSTSSSSSSIIYDRRSVKGGKIRPRWQAHERLKLFLAIAEDKQLEDMSTFRWGPIACKVGRSRKACKDQWRREVYRSIVQYLEKMASQEDDESDREDDDDDDEEEMDDDNIDDHPMES